jgi:A/G-specific adenine glycosylase
MARILEFENVLWGYYGEHGRHGLPWRIPEHDGTFNAYKILVSEIMLQQTQVSRVVKKYDEFVEAFPTAEVLAAAPLSEVLRAWSGLGYNRRAKFLHHAAQQIIQEYAGALPQDSLKLA